MIFYIWPAFFPIHNVYAPKPENLQKLMDQVQEALQNPTTKLAKKLLQLQAALYFKNGYSIWIPFFISIPSGFLKGAMNIMGLVNDSAVPGCIVLMLTPFVILSSLALSTTIIQVQGSYLLGLGLLFLIIGKLKVYYYLSLFITGNVKEMGKRNIGKKALVFTVVGFALILTWACITFYSTSTFLQNLERIINDQLPEDKQVNITPQTEELKTVAKKFIDGKNWFDWVNMIQNFFTQVCL